MKETILTEGCLKDFTDFYYNEFSGYHFPKGKMKVMRGDGLYHSITIGDLLDLPIIVWKGVFEKFLLKTDTYVWVMEMHTETTSEYYFEVESPLGGVMSLYIEPKTTYTDWEECWKDAIIWINNNYNLS